MREHRFSWTEDGKPGGLHVTGLSDRVVIAIATGLTASDGIDDVNVTEVKQVERKVYGKP